MDGLKPSQRKVLYGVLKKNTSKELKVDQLRGFIGEKTAYHHGDMSLNETIISMNHDYVGSNNINLLIPCGQLGTRLMGGKDAASPRYISTKINPLTRIIYNSQDDNLLNYLDDDGYPIEPDYYWPCIPMVLVNGSAGIGTGYSTDIPCFNPKELIRIIFQMIDNPSYRINELNPSYKNFKGKIYKSEKGWCTEGKITRVDRTTLRISELPIGTWTQKYKEHLDKLIETGEINDIIDNTTETKISFDIKAPRLQIEDWLQGDIIKLFKLKSSIKCNLTVFDENRKIKIFETVEEIILHFYKVRKDLYKKRYNHLENSYKKEIEEIQAKVLFIQRIITGEIKVFRIPKKDVEEQLKNQEFPKIEESFNYLLDMKIHHFTEEKIEQLEKELKNMKTILDKLLSKTYKDLWKEDLVKLDENLK